MNPTRNMLALMLSEAPWQYYIKYETFLYELDHPFRNHIHFLRDTRLAFPSSIFKRYKVIAFYYHDPLKNLYPEQYAYAKQLETFCKQEGIRLINTPNALSNTTKTIQLNLLMQAGIRVALSLPYHTENDLAPFFKQHIPFFIRYNDGHDSQGEFVQGPFYSYKQFISQFNPSTFNENRHLKNTCAIQWINTQCADGLYRKYRVYATRFNAIKGFVTQSESWYIHGNNAHNHQEAHAKQAKYLATELSVDDVIFFTRICNILNLDFCAIDYAYLPSGDIVIWEANPHPALSDKEPSRTRITHFLSQYYLQQLNSTH